MTIDEIISNAIIEDVKNNDHTSSAVVDQDITESANLLVKENGILAGLEIAKKVFKVIDPDLCFKKYKKDGEIIKPGDIAFTVSGNARAILKSERLALNFMQRMSGIATKTAKYVELVKGTGVKILDTRKTTPNMRVLEKLAVKTGGGCNHRMGLYDMIMIKDNHVDFAGGIKKAIQKANEYLEKHDLDLKIEIEVRNLAELKEVLQTGNVDIIMLDNFALPELKKAVKMVNGKYKTEASGGITEDSIRRVALCGVDYISVGALTHHIKSLDMSLKAI